MQMSFFDGQQDFYNDKPIRLIELFGGYGDVKQAVREFAERLKDACDGHIL